MTGPPRPLLALALGAACVLMLLIAWRFRKEAKRIALAPFAAWRELAGDRAMNAALGSAASLFGVLACMVLVRLNVPGALWAVFLSAVFLDASLWGMYAGTPAFASAIQKARRYTDVEGALGAARRAEAAATEAAAAARADADLATDHLFTARLPVMGVDALGSGVVDRCAPEFAAQFGLTAPAFVGRNYAEFVHPDDLAETVRVVTRILDDGAWLDDFRNRWCVAGRTHHMEWHQMTPDGRVWKGREVTAEVERDARLREAEADLDAIRPTVERLVRAPVAVPPPGDAPPPPQLHDR